MKLSELKPSIKENVQAALVEDVGNGDITANLVPAATQYHVQVISRENATVCGTAWVDEAFQQVDPNVDVEWLVADGETVESNAILFRAKGDARSILTAERTALNFLQLLSGVATASRRYSQLVEDYATKILDTRKTIPGLRLAQKYAVKCGGCDNHRMGLYDAFLIKENHIAACGSISAAIQTARKQHPEKPLEVEVENLEQFREALSMSPDIIMLDELTLEDIGKAVELNKTKNNGRCKIEASGNMTAERIPQIADTGVDYISIGSLTKHVRAIDLSMRFISG